MPRPPAWAAKEAVLRARETEPADPLWDWKHAGEALAIWFHRWVREPGEPANCAYCDGELDVTSGETIDHFIPVALARRCDHPELVLAWENLYPACALCNCTAKRGHWSPFLIRPDAGQEPPVEALFELDPTTGTVEPAPEASPADQRRVASTIRVFDLNNPRRKRARMRVIRAIEAALRAENGELLEDYAQQGPYRYIARRLQPTPARGPREADGLDGGAR